MYRLTKDAKKNLKDIRQYTLDNWGKQKVSKYLAGLRETMRMLSNSPGMGVHRPDVEEGIYSFSYESHTIYYFTEKNLVIIAGVLHKNMVPANHLEEGLSGKK